VSCGVNKDLEIKNVIDPVCDDAEYVREVAETKRVLELWTMEPGFQQAFLDAPEETLKAHGLEKLDPLGVKILCDHETALEYQKRPREELPRLVLRYRGFIAEKKEERRQMAQKDCVPVHPAFRAWRGRQLNRCWVEFGVRNESIIHAPATFELDLGCSVGCPFCGIAAKRLEKVCPFDEENAALWKGILTWFRETVGPAAGFGTCYYATEPLDNPDYEKFSDGFFEVFGVVPQLTTAVSMRKPERTRAFLKDALKKYRRVHRFSVLSLDILHKIHETFTPEELICVELLPQFPEAPACHFARAGRARSGEMEKKTTSDDTIACISGLIVNMAERSIRLLTPCLASEERPTGEYLAAKEFFTDLESFRRAADGLVEKYMLPELPKDQPLVLRPGVSFDKTEEGVEFFTPGKLRMKFLGTDDLDPTLYHGVLDKLEQGGKSAYDIAEELMTESSAFPASIFFILRKFELAGLFLEPYEIKASGK